MSHGKWQTIRSFQKYVQDSRGIKRTTGRKSGLLLLSATLLSSIANGQLPTTTALPYLLTNDGLPGAPVVVSSFSVARVPAAVAQTNIGGLLGGGFAAALTVGIGSSSEAAAAAVAIASARKVQALRTLNATNKIKQQMQQDAAQGKANEEAQLTQACPIKPNTIKSARYLRAKASRKLRAEANRNSRVTAGLHLKANDIGGCSLQEEDEADAAEEELEELTEVGNASEEAIEGAEEAAEAAEVAAEAAEEVAEAAEVAIDVFEGLLEALSLF